MNESTFALRRVFAGDFSEWHGLPETANLLAVSEALRPSQVATATETTRAFRRAWHSELRLTPSECVEVWEEWDRSAVFLIERDDPLVSDLDATLENLGAPELVEQDKRAAVGLTVHELTYASRGLTLSIGNPYSQDSAERRRCVHLQLYRKSSVQYYLTEIGAGTGIMPHLP